MDFIHETCFPIFLGLRIDFVNLNSIRLINLLKAILFFFTVVMIFSNLLNKFLFYLSESRLDFYLFSYRAQ